MSSRKEKFEANRRKMLKSVGVDVKEPEPEHVKSDYPENLQRKDDDFREKLQILQSDMPSVEEYEERADQATCDELDFTNELFDLPKEEREHALNLKHNQHTRAKKRLEQRGEVNPFGESFYLCQEFYQTGGGGLLFFIIAAVTILPEGIFWAIRGEHWLLAVITIFFLLAPLRLFTFVLRYIVDVIDTEANSGPLHVICKVREGTPDIKMIVKCLNAGIVFVKNLYIVIALFIVFIFVKEYQVYTVENWIYYYYAMLGMIAFFSGIAWLFARVLINPIYERLLETFIDSNCVRYVLYYYYEPSRLMFTSRKGPLPSTEERLRAFRRDVIALT